MSYSRPGYSNEFYLSFGVFDVTQLAVNIIVYGVESNYTVVQDFKDRENRKMINVIKVEN